MKSLDRRNLERMSLELKLLEEYEQRNYVGGTNCIHGIDDDTMCPKCMGIDPVSLDTYYAMDAQGLWPGGWFYGPDGKPSYAPASIKKVTGQVVTGYCERHGGFRGDSCPFGHVGGNDLFCETHNTWFDSSNGCNSCGSGTVSDTITGTVTGIFTGYAQSGSNHIGVSGIYNGNIGIVNGSTSSGGSTSGGNKGGKGDGFCISGSVNDSNSEYPDIDESYIFRDGSKVSVKWYGSELTFADGKTVTLIGAYATGGYASTNTAFQYGGFIGYEDSAQWMTAETLCHEYGHFLQQKILEMFGLDYLKMIAVPSMLSVLWDSLTGYNLHDQRWFEQWATEWGNWVKSFAT